MSRKIKVSLFLCMGLTLCALYRITPTTPISKPLPTIHAPTRIGHAKELFGLNYSRSLVRRTEHITGTEKFILEKTEAGLPPGWRSQAKVIASAIIDEANKNELDPVFLLALIIRESRLNPETRGRHGEIGLMQIKPKTAQWIAQKASIPWEGLESLLNPVINIQLGVAYFSHLRNRYDKHSRFYISAYNMGPKRLQLLLNQNTQPKDYVGHVMAIYSQFYRQLIQQSQYRAQAAAQFRLASAE